MADKDDEPRSITDVLVSAMEAASDGDAEICLVLFAKKDGTLLGWRSNIDSSVLRIGLATACASGMFASAFIDGAGK